MSEKLKLTSLIINNRLVEAFIHNLFKNRTKEIFENLVSKLYVNDGIHSARGWAKIKLNHRDNTEPNATIRFQFDQDGRYFEIDTTINCDRLMEDTNVIFGFSMYTKKNQIMTDDSVTIILDHKPCYNSTGFNIYPYMKAFQEEAVMLTTVCKYLAIDDIITYLPDDYDQQDTIEYYQLVDGDVVRKKPWVTVNNGHHRRLVIEDPYVHQHGPANPISLTASRSLTSDTDFLEKWFL